MKQETQMHLTKGDRYIDPKDATKGSAQGNPYKTKHRPKFLKPSGSKVQLESQLVEALLQTIADNLEEGEIFDAAMRLGEHYIAASTKMPNHTVGSTPTRTQNNLTTHRSSTSGSGAASTAKIVTKAHRDAKRAADEGAVWRAVNGGVHKQKKGSN